MGSVEGARAIVLATGLVCAACQFETGALAPQGELAPSTATRGAHDASGGSAAPTAVPTASAGAGANARAGAPAGGAEPDAAVLAPPAAQAGAGSSADDTPAAAEDAAMAPTAEASDPNDAATDAATAQPDPDPQPDPADAATAPEPAAPIPGALFSPCSASADCADGRVCTSTIPSQSGFSGQPGYCAELCPWSNGSAGTCTQPETGLIKASCQLNGVCLLGACDRSVCPDGLRCVETEAPIGGGQVVRYSVCQP